VLGLYSSMHWYYISSNISGSILFPLISYIYGKPTILYKRLCLEMASCCIVAFKLFKSLPPSLTGCNVAASQSNQQSRLQQLCRWTIKSICYQRKKMQRQKFQIVCTFNGLIQKMSHIMHRTIQKLHTNFESTLGH